MADRLYYSAYAVDPDRLPTYVGAANQVVTAWTDQVGGTQVTDLTSDADGTTPIGQLRTDPTGSFGAFIEAGTAPDDLVWFAIVGSTAPRFAIGPSSGGFVTRAVVESLMAQDPTFRDTVVELIQSTAGLAVSDTLVSTKYPGDEWFAADEAGHPSDLGFAGDGSVAEATAVSLHTVRGLPRTTPAADGTVGMRFQDEAGHDAWVGWDGVGLPDQIAQTGIIYGAGIYAGRDQPFVLPGETVLWLKFISVDQAPEFVWVVG